MSKAQYRSRSYKRTKVKRADGLKIKYKRKRVRNSFCVCGRKLAQTTKGSTTKKRVSRPHNNLCSKCMRRYLIEAESGAL